MPHFKARNWIDWEIRIRHQIGREFRQTAMTCELQGLPISEMARQTSFRSKSFIFY